jgi:tartrate dehydratase alpha subunit/fumarate hydratase class I-like protein
MPTVIQQADFIQSIADALQFISYYHPVDYLRASTRPTSASSRRRPRTRWRSS